MILAESILPSPLFITRRPESRAIYFSLPITVSLSRESAVSRPVISIHYPVSEKLSELYQPPFYTYTNKCRFCVTFFARTSTIPYTTNYSANGGKMCALFSSRLQLPPAECPSGRNEAIQHPPARLAFRIGFHRNIIKIARISLMQPFRFFDIIPGMDESRTWKTPGEIADEWGISDRRVRILCAEGRINPTRFDGKHWLISPRQSATQSTNHSTNTPHSRPLAKIDSWYESNDPLCFLFAPCRTQ